MFVCSTQSQPTDGDLLLPTHMQTVSQLVSQSVRFLRQRHFLVSRVPVRYSEGFRGPIPATPESVECVWVAIVAVLPQRSRMGQDADCCTLCHSGELLCRALTACFAVSLRQQRDGNYSLSPSV